MKIKMFKKSLRNWFIIDGFLSIFFNKEQSNKILPLEKQQQLKSIISILYLLGHLTNLPQHLGREKWYVSKWGKQLVQ